MASRASGKEEPTSSKEDIQPTTSLRRNFSVSATGEAASASVAEAMPAEPTAPAAAFSAPVASTPTAALLLTKTGLQGLMYMTFLPTAKSCGSRERCPGGHSGSAIAAAGRRSTIAAAGWWRTIAAPGGTRTAIETCPYKWDHGPERALGLKKHVVSLAKGITEIRAMQCQREHCNYHFHSSCSVVPLAQMGHGSLLKRKIC